MLDHTETPTLEIPAHIEQPLRGIACIKVGPAFNDERVKALQSALGLVAAERERFQLERDAARSQVAQLQSRVEFLEACLEVEQGRAEDARQVADNWRAMYLYTAKQ